MRKSIKLQFATNGTFLDIMCRIQHFYKILDVPIAKPQHEITYPNKQKTNASGMKISARLVTCLSMNTIRSEDLSVGDCAVTQLTMWILTLNPEKWL